MTLVELKTNLGLFHVADGALTSRNQKSFPSNRFSGLESIVDEFLTETFMKAFTAKGRLSSLLEAIPVRVILNDKTALLGAARAAARQAVLRSSA